MSDSPQTHSNPGFAYPNLGGDPVANEPQMQNPQAYPPQSPAPPKTEPSAYAPQPQPTPPPPQQAAFAPQQAQPQQAPYGNPVGGPTGNPVGNQEPPQQPMPFMQQQQQMPFMPYDQQRMNIHDYKYNDTAFQRGNPALQRSFQQPQPLPNLPKTARGRRMVFQLSDDRVIWAGAIFIFFGVFLFLIGYWIGKTASSRANAQTLPLIQAAERQLQQERLQSQVGAGIVQPTVPTPPSVPAAPQAVASAPESQAPAPAPAKPKPAPTRPKAKAPVRAKPQASRPVRAAAPKKAAAPTQAVSDAGSYTIQVAAHTRIAQAQATESTLRDMGYRAYIVETQVNGKTYYRVRVGQYDSRSAANSVLTKLHQSSMGRDSVLVKQ